MKTTRLKIEGLNSLAGMEQMEKTFEAIPGVVAADVKLDDITTIEHEGVDERKLMEVVMRLGDYRVHIVREDAVFQE